MFSIFRYVSGCPCWAPANWGSLAPFVFCPDPTCAKRQYVSNDLEGRRRLLLEPIPDNEEEDDEYDSAYIGISHLIDEGYRPRSDNTNIQLLLVHYNGWPHRWDEWIE